MEEIVLYQYGGTNTVPSLSPPCLKVFLALRRLGLPHRVENLTSPFQVWRKSPTARVPAITMGGATIADSVFILDRLQDAHPLAELWPKDPSERAIDRLWDCFATDTLYWQGFYLRWLVPENRQRVLDASFGAGVSVRKTMVKVIGGTMLKQRAKGQGIGGRAPQDVQTSFRTSMTMVEAGLGTGPFLQSRRQPGRGDLAVAAHFAQFSVGRDEAVFGKVKAAHPRLFEHGAATFEACGLPAP